MRDPNRIDVICDLLRDVWKQIPESLILQVGMTASMLKMIHLKKR